MGLGFGSLKQMNDTIRYNRDLLGKKKSAREIYKDEIKKRTSNHENENIEYVLIRVSERLKRNKIQEVLAGITSVVIILFILSITLWAISSFYFTEKTNKKHNDNESLFKTIIYRQLNGSDLKTDYYIHGPKAAETLYKGKQKHQNSESYYESGHQFRSALYFHDTLVTEMYFFTTGDTIKHFPNITDKEIHRMTLFDNKRSKKIEFNFYDGKIIQGTYKETWVTK